VNKVVIVFLGIFFGLGFLVLLRFFLEIYVEFRSKNFEKRVKFSVVSVRVSRVNEIGPKVAEQIFATLHGIYQQASLFERLRGFTADKISFEIANIDRSIKFYVVFPSHLRNLVEGQIYAQYPDVEIEDVSDYAAEIGGEIIDGDRKKALVALGAKRSGNENVQINQFAAACGVELKLTSPDIYPIKRYSQFEDKIAKTTLDPLASITATLAKLGSESDQAWIQIVVKPLPENWRLVFRRCARILDRGVFANIGKLTALYASWYLERRAWVRMLFAPLYFGFWLQGFSLERGKFDADGNSLGSNVPAELLSGGAHDGETSTQAAMDKIVKLLFDCNLRILYVPKNPDKNAAKMKLREIAGSFKQFNLAHLNGFKINEFLDEKEALERYRNRLMVNPMVLNTEELATLFHLPNATVTTPNIYWVRSKKLEPPIDLPLSKNSEDLTVLGKTNFRGENQVFGIKTPDRRRHTYIIGKTGMGKSTLLENMIFSDIQAGRGLAVIDPHGDLAEAVLNFVPSHRTNDVVIFNPADREFPVAFNMLENIDPAYNSIVCSGLVGIFKKIYADSWGPRLEHILRNTILSLLEYPNTTMLGITRILQDKDFRQKVVRRITDPIVRSFWENEFEKMQDKMRVEAISPILNKVGQFLSSPIVRNIVGQPKSAVDLRFMMDKKKIIVVNLSKGLIGEDISSLLGSMMITKFQLDAMSRANIPEKDRVDFYLYVDEFQNFATDSFATILSEARKYKLNLTMANQYIAQMPDEVRDAVFGNVGSILSFQVGFDDAEYLSQQYGEEVLPSDLVSLSKYTAYMRLLVDGMPTKTFSLDTMAPPSLELDAERVGKIIKVSREKYAAKREEVEDKIRRWSLAGEEKKLLPKPKLDLKTQVLAVKNQKK
jgi:hypothetical protein